MAAARPHTESTERKVSFFHESPEFGTKPGVPCAFTIRQEDLDYYGVTTTHKHTGAPLDASFRTEELGHTINKLLPPSEAPFVYLRSSSRNPYALTLCILDRTTGIDRMKRIIINDNGELSTTTSTNAGRPLTLEAIRNAARDQDFAALLATIIVDMAECDIIPYRVARALDTPAKVLEHMVVPNDVKRAYTLKLGRGLVPLNLGDEGKLRLPAREMTAAERNEIYGTESDLAHARRDDLYGRTAEPLPELIATGFSAASAAATIPTDAQAGTAPPAPEKATALFAATQRELPESDHCEHKPGE